MITGIDTLLFFFFNDTATTEIYTLSLHDALPIYPLRYPSLPEATRTSWTRWASLVWVPSRSAFEATPPDEVSARGSACDSRSEEHTSELQSRQYLVCRLLLEKKKIYDGTNCYYTM